jgi:hypothetical protein
MMAEEKKIEVRYLTSMITAVPDKDGLVKHLQFTVVQEVESGKIRCYFDVVDPSKIKLKEDDTVSEPNPA